MTTTDNIDFIRYYAPQIGLIGVVLVALLTATAVGLKRRYGHIKPIFVDILDGGDTKTPAAKWGVRFLAFLTIASVVALILETEPSIYLSYGGILMGIEVFALAFFTLELILRLWLAPEIQNDQNRVRAMTRYLMSPMGIIDILTVIPGWLFFFPGSEQFSAIRVLRLLRLFKLGQYAMAINLLDDVIRQKKSLLVTTVGLALMLLVGVSTLMFIIEGPLQPERMGSIPLALWWGVVTMATIGYGDVVPVTGIGKILSGLVAFIGIGVFALPTAIMATGLLEIANQKRDDACYVALKNLQHAHQEGHLTENSPLWNEAQKALEHSKT
jgi:voltage-gated potassium channel